MSACSPFDIANKEKSPAEILDYGFTWAGWLETGETIISSGWTAESPLTLSNQDFSGTVTKVFVSGGVSGTTRSITNTVTTSHSPTRTAVRIMKLTIKER